MEAKKITVLAIDDDPGDIELLHRFLEEIPEWEIKFLDYTEPADGLAQLSHCAADIILLDYLLGTTTGLEVYKKMQHYDYKCPVVIMTGHGDEEIATELMRSGVADYLPKNRLSARSLKRVISNAIAKYKLQEALDEHRWKLEKTNQDLLRKNQEIRSLYHIISHELASPLTSAQDYISLVLDGQAGPLTDKQTKFLKIAKESCSRMCLYINDLLDVTRLQTGKLAINTSTASIEKLVSHIVTSMSPDSQRKGIRLKLDIEPDLPEVCIDEVRITQVLTNLLRNALKFTPKGGEISIRASETSKSSEFVQVSVSDTGRGIEPNHLGSIFDLFYQERSTDSLIEQGLGMGLYISRELVRQHGGDIWVQSESGKGSTFSFTIPKNTPRKTSHTVMEGEGVYEKDLLG